MMDEGMMIDPDHMSVRARNHLLSVVEARQLLRRRVEPLVVDARRDAAHLQARRLRRPVRGRSTSFVDAWRKTKPLRDKRFYFGFGYGADANGFGEQGPPREGAEANPVTYPFKSFDGKQTIHQQKSGERVYNINADGVAHYGLYPDWIEDLRKLGGNEIVEDMARGSEAYLQMWERAEGVPATSCVQSRVTFSRARLHAHAAGRHGRGACCAAPASPGRGRAARGRTAPAAATAGR